MAVLMSLAVPVTDAPPPLPPLPSLHMRPVRRPHTAVPGARPVPLVIIPPARRPGTGSGAKKDPASNPASMPAAGTASQAAAGTRQDRDLGPNHGPSHAPGRETGRETGRSRPAWRKSCGLAKGYVSLLTLALRDPQRLRQNPSMPLPAQSRPARPARPAQSHPVSLASPAPLAPLAPPAPPAPPAHRPHRSYRARRVAVTAPPAWSRLGTASGWPVLVILAGPAALTLRLMWRDGAAPAEGAYLNSWPADPGHWLPGSAGLTAGRLLSLALMLVATTLLHGTTRRLYDRRSAFFACSRAADGGSSAATARAIVASTLAGTTMSGVRSASSANSGSIASVPSRSHASSALRVRTSLGHGVSSAAFETP